ncbi:hypothetical protein [uncultured Corynebacterium sp.]|uniref:hypothetical protein n=1 Tax=uncultured Corynebacterium sp. TaxID=159447 RepID=UPI002889ED5D|nr:hypothetical protein [uncultured Corynebacterium sp.]
MSEPELQRRPAFQQKSPIVGKRDAQPSPNLKNSNHETASRPETTRQALEMA